MNIHGFKFCMLFLCLWLGIGEVWAGGHARKLRVHKVSGHDFVLLKDVANFYGFAGVKEDANGIVLKSQWTTLQFQPKSRMAHINKMAVWLQSGTRKVGKDWALSHVDLQNTVDPVLRPYAHLYKNGYHTVVLDPGHGGDDSGALSFLGLQEKDVALEISNMVKKKLEAAGVKVLMTRTGDVGLTLDERVSFAKTAKADMFLSIHLNSVIGSSAEGLETYLMTLPGHASTNDPGGNDTPTTIFPGNKHNAANMLLAWSIHKSVVGGGKQADRGLRRARFLVLKNAACPAALVECGFLSNNKEAKLLKTDTHRNLVATQISKGIQHYLGQVTKAHLMEVTNLPGRSETATLKKTEKQETEQ